MQIENKVKFHTLLYPSPSPPSWFHETRDTGHVISTLINGWVPTGKNWTSARFLGLVPKCCCPYGCPLNCNGLVSGIHKWYQTVFHIHGTNFLCLYSWTIKIVILQKSIWRHCLNDAPRLDNIKEREFTGQDADGWKTFCMRIFSSYSFINFCAGWLIILSWSQTLMNSFF